ncbi:MAG: UbiA family prenyltransferase [Candidatus Pacebacteria bacterium]|nr:UbiA family prenyltransferase [Candidatus Paceibacterota bacterium]MDD5722058.1 UbiA family prenyltransferase [Candidatus Paceibacterota bacterium]
MKTLYYIFLSFRPKKLIKNLFVFVPLLFSGMVFNLPLFLKAGEAFLLFSLFTGVAYLFNDVLDQEKDKKHPIKSQRPIASGKLNPSIALFSSLILIILGLWLSLQINLKFAVIAVLYLIINMIYTLWLEHVRYICSFCAGLGYVLRVLAGGAIINLTLNIWYIIFGFVFGLLHFFYKNAFTDEGVNTQIAK